MQVHRVNQRSDAPNLFPKLLIANFADNQANRIFYAGEGNFIRIQDNKSPHIP